MPSRWKYKDAEPNAEAQALVAKRWAKTTPEERSALMRELAMRRWHPDKVPMRALERALREKDSEP